VAFGHVGALTAGRSVSSGPAAEPMRRAHPINPRCMTVRIRLWHRTCSMGHVSGSADPLQDIGSLRKRPLGPLGRPCRNGEAAVQQTARQSVTSNPFLRLGDRRAPRPLGVSPGPLVSTRARRSDRDALQRQQTAGERARGAWSCRLPRSGWVGNTERPQVTVRAAMWVGGR